MIILPMKVIHRLKILLTQEAGKNSDNKTRKNVKPSHSNETIREQQSIHEDETDVQPKNKRKKEQVGKILEKRELVLNSL